MATIAHDHVRPLAGQVANVANLPRVYLASNRRSVNHSIQHVGGCPTRQLSRTVQVVAAEWAITRISSYVSRDNLAKHLYRHRRAHSPYFVRGSFPSTASRCQREWLLFSPPADQTSPLAAHLVIGDEVRARCASVVRSLRDRKGRFRRNPPSAYFIFRKQLHPVWSNCYDKRC